MKSWARAEPMDPWAHGLSPGPNKKIGGAGTGAQGRANSDAVEQLIEQRDELNLMNKSNAQKTQNNQNKHKITIGRRIKVVTLNIQGMKRKETAIREQL